MQVLLLRLPTSRQEEFAAGPNPPPPFDLVGIMHNISNILRTLIYQKLCANILCRKYIESSSRTLTGYSECRRVLRSVERYDPATQSWNFSTVFPDARSALVAATIGDCLFAVGGSVNGREVASGYKFCKGNGQWTPIAAMASARRFHAAASK